MSNRQFDAALWQLQRLTDAAAGRATDGHLLERFTAHRDEQAFAELVARHGPLVWGVCRRVLRHEQDAEDAFQAAFLVLARRASVVRRGEALGAWLHRVACRVAARVRRTEARRKEYVPPEIARPSGDPVPEVIARELRALIDEELLRLPEKLHVPFVLCCLEGKTKGEAARELGWPEGTVSGRLAQAREQLRQRLARRGVSLVAVPSVSVLAGGSGWAALVPAILRAVRGGGETSVAGALAGKVVRAMTRDRMKTGMLVLVLGLLVGAGTLAHQGTPEKPNEGERKKAGGRPAGPGEKRAVDQQGDPLPKGAVARLGTVRLRHAGRALAVAFSPDGKTLASGGGDAVIRLWDVRTGKETQRLVGHEDAVEYITFSPDGRLLASTGDQTVRLWDRATGKELRRWKGRRDGAGAVAFSPDSRRIAVAEDQEVRLREVATGKELVRLAGKSPAIPPLAFSPDGKTLASACWGEQGKKVVAVILWETETGKERKRLVGHTEPMRSVAFSPDGKALVTGSTDRTIRAWDPDSGKELHRLAWPGKYEGPGIGDGRSHGGVTSLVFGPAGKFVVAGGDGEAIRRWETATGKLLRHVEGRKAIDRAVALSPNGKVLAATDGPTLLLWDTSTGKELLGLDLPCDPVEGVAFTRGGAVVSIDGVTARVWETAGAGRQRRLPEGTYGGAAFAFSPDGSRLASSDDVGKLRIVDTTTGKEVFRPLKVVGVPESLALSADGKLLASSNWAEQDSTQIVRVWDLKTGKVLHQLRGPSAGPLAFSPDGRLLAQGSGSPLDRDRQKVVLWETANGKEVRRIGAGLYAVNALAFSPDGKLLATGGYRSDRGPAFGVRLWDVSTGKKVREFHGNEEDGARPNVLALAFSADGRMLASAGTGHVVHVWEVVSGRERVALRGHEGAVYALAFSGDGRLLASGSEDTTALVWDLTGKPRNPAAP